MKIPNKYQKLAATAITLCLVAMITIVLGQGFQDSIPEVVWTMVNVNHAEQQGDAHLIQVKQGKTVLIDAGYLQPAEQQLVPFLQNHNINHLDLVFVSHAHRDHYQGITAIINAGITIKEVYFNIPDKTICDREIPWGCNYLQLSGGADLSENAQRTPS